MSVSAVKNSVFFLLPQGKPNPEIARPEQGEDTRERVVQKTPKGPTCWYNALKILREQYGPKAPSVFLKARVLEKLISEYRKTLNSARKDYLREEECARAQRIDPVFKRLLHAVSPEMALIQSKMIGEKSQGPVKLAELMKDFSAQSTYADLGDFVHHRKLSRLIEIHSLYLRILKTDPAVEFEKEMAIRPWHTLTYKDLPDEFKATFLSTLAIRTIARDVYHMSESKWTPFEKVDGLIEKLTERGPMFVCGLFGRTFYNAPPKAMENKLHGKTIWYWPVGSALPDDGASPSHSIIIVGANNEGSRGGVVYFIDPSDGSDPSDPERQKVYAMSYQRLAEKVHDLFGERFSSFHHTPLIPYALHGALRFKPA
ncbi:MAG: hypothetical protein JSR39_02370 [Verrucomicrobia bacterium]|nr:hypothetical protein [Verrucomicrobiota bacterium]